MKKTSQRRHSSISDVRAVRTVVTRSGAMPRGYFPSLKNGQMVAYEQTLEADACILFEMSPLIRSFRGQPERIWFPDRDRTRSYTPDFELELLCGKRVLVEIKPAKRLAELEIREKFNRIEEHMARMATPFVILTEESIRQQPRLTNLRELRRDMPLSDISPDAIWQSLRTLTRAGAKTLGEATTLVSASTTVALLTQGFATCALDKPLVASIPITILQEPEHAWFFLAQGRGF